VAEDELWDVAAVAAYLGVKRNTVTSYLARRQMPEPDFRFGQSPVWRADKIKTWHEGRPGRGGRRSEADAP
jgi:predicted DNA-binding transcriptional regulator AlpA